MPTLAQLPVHQQAHVQGVGIINLVIGHDPWPDGPVGIE